MLSAALLHDKLSYRSHVLWCKDLYLAAHDWSPGPWELVRISVNLSWTMVRWQVTWLQDYTDQSEITAIFVLYSVKLLAWKSVKYKR
jgi:hypothetical protein